MRCRQVRVLYSTTLDKSKKASMTKIVKRLGGSVEDKEGPEFTHFVTLQPTSPGQTDRGFKKSINALIALAAGQQLCCSAPAAVSCVALLLLLSDVLLCSSCCQMCGVLHQDNLHMSAAVMIACASDATGAHCLLHVVLLHSMVDKAKQPQIHGRKAGRLVSNPSACNALKLCFRFCFSR